MAFTTVNFIIFFAGVFFLYYFIPKAKQWWLLLLASYVFYAFASPIYLIFLFATTLITFFSAILIEKNKQKNKIIIVLGSIMLIGMIVFFKYSLFLLENVKALLGIFSIDFSVPALNLIIPVGLSFYVFQSLGYLIDVYREMVPAERNFFRYALYAAYFPQLLQGPIGTYQSLAPQLFEKHEFSYQNAKFGLQRVVWGFFKKLMIANRLAALTQAAWADYNSNSGILFWGFILVCYAVELYADFSGYMDIAVGCSQMLGITLSENFDAPYFSGSISEFWRRWHITLGEWFRNYVFYPVLRTDLCNNLRKKNRKTHPFLSKVLPTTIALLTVWFFIGLWHGANWSFVVYGLYHGSFIILAEWMSPFYSKFNRRNEKITKSKGFQAFRILRTFAIVTFGYVIFCPADLAVSGYIIKSAVKSFGLDSLRTLASADIKEWLTAAISIFVLFFADWYHLSHPSPAIREKIETFPVVFRWIIYFAAVFVLLLFGSYGGQQTFIYFQF